MRADTGLASAVRLVAEFHDAVADFAPDADVEWADGPVDLGRASPCATEIWAPGT